MNWLAKRIVSKEDFFLRLAIGLPLIWAGVSSIMSPTNWIGFVPDWIQTFIPKESFMMLHGIGELGLGILLIAGTFPVLLSALAFLDITAILVFNGVDDITFRDLGLSIVALILLARQIRK